MRIQPRLPRGGEWLLEPGAPGAVFTPERASEEQRLIARTAAEFVTREVLPALDRLEQKDWTLARRLLARCGELGLLGIELPERDGGGGLDVASSMMAGEQISRSASFGATYGAQANLTLIPLHLFGTDAQKRKYLPRLLSGELVGAYALSEAGSGSDALAAKTRAVRRADGGFALTGEKLWITNGGFADLFIVFAKVDGEHFTAFIVERAFGGVTSGREEHKMGLHGSSTTPLVLDQAPVPAENVLGEIGRGHKVAFNVLNFGRFKLGSSCVGGARAAIEEAVTYAAARRQFGRPIAEFGAIRHKIGEMIGRTYAVESLVYRIAGLLDGRIAAASPEAGPGAAALAALEEYAVEASIAKVAGSEALEFVLDENVQIHGGNGYVADYPAERHLRDARVNRIFEGTNEINRLLMSGLIARRAAKGDLAILPAARALEDELLAPPGIEPEAGGGRLAAEHDALARFRKTAVMLFGLAMQRFGAGLSDEQEILMQLADVLVAVFGAESAVLRAEAAAAQAAPDAGLHVEAARLVTAGAAMRIEMAARQALAAAAEGDTLRVYNAAARRLFRYGPVNLVPIRRRLADEAVKRAGYPFAP